MEGDLDTLDKTGKGAKATSGASLVSVVVPVYNEHKNVKPLFDALEEVTGKMPELTWEYVFVDDGSKDDSAKVIGELARAHDKVKLVSLARNFGKEIALSAGVSYARGDAVITMDADLQHPPALVPELVRLWREGAEVVVGTRLATSKKSIVRRIMSRLFHFMSRLASGDATRVDGTDFRLIDAKVRSAFLEVGERRRAYRQIVDWLGFKRETIAFDAPERFEGTPTYSLPKLWELAIDMIVSRSSTPLRMLLYVGVLITFASTASLAWMILAFHYVDKKWWYTPLAQAVVFNTLLIGVLLTAIGVLGLYVARIHEEVLGRPLFTVRATLNCDKARPGEDEKPAR